MSILRDKSFAFASRIVKEYGVLTHERKEFVLSKQLIRSGTATGALIRESKNAETRKDFIHKLSVALKECDETIYWLELLSENHFLSKSEFNSL